MDRVLGMSHCIVLALGYDWLVTVNTLWRHELQTGQRTLCHFFSKNGFLANEIRHFIDYVIGHVTSSSTTCLIIIRSDTVFNAKTIKSNTVKCLSPVTFSLQWVWRIYLSLNVTETWFKIPPRIMSTRIRGLACIVCYYRNYMENCFLLFQLRQNSSNVLPACCFKVFLWEQIQKAFTTVAKFMSNSASSASATKNICNINIKTQSPILCKWYNFGPTKELIFLALWKETISLGNKYTFFAWHTWNIKMFHDNNDKMFHVPCNN